METLTDPKDPLGILKKPKTSAPPAEEKDPLGILKKKEDTVSEENSGVGGKAQPATAASKPLSEESKPVEKSTSALDEYKESIQFNPKEDLIQKQDETAIKPIDELKSATRSEMLALNKTSQEFDETGASQALGSFNKAVVSGVAAIPKSVAILAKKLDDFTGVPSKPIEEYSTYQMGDWLDKKAAEVGIGATDPTRDGFLNTQVPQALGSVAAIMLTGGRGLVSNTGKEVLVNAPKGILGTVKSAVTNPATVSGGLQMAVPEYEAAKAAGMNDDEAFTVFLKNYGVGQTEALPLARAFNRISKITGGSIVETLKAGAQGGLEEATQELVQTYFQNQIAKGSYDPARDPLMGMLEAGNTGFFVGFILPGIGSALRKAPPEIQKKVESFLNDKFKNVPSPPSPKQVVSESQSSVQSTDDTQGAMESADKIVAATETYKPGDTVELSAEMTNKDENVGDLTLSEQKSENKQVGDGLNEQIKPETINPEMSPTLMSETSEQSTPVQEADITTVGNNYQKVGNEWQVKQADGTWAPVINKSATKSEQNTELAQLKEIRSQLEAQEPQNIKMSTTEKGRIAQLEPYTLYGAVRKMFWDGAKVLWETKDLASSKPRKGIKEEAGIRKNDATKIKKYIDDKKGLSVDQLAEQLALRGFDEMEAKDAIIEVLAQSDPDNWYAEQLEQEDPDYLLGAESRYDQINELSGKISQLELQEQAIQETNQQLYENERRVNQGTGSEGNSPTGVSDQQRQGEGITTNQSPVSGQQIGETGGDGQGRKTQEEPVALIRENGNADQSKQALTDLESKNLTHVQGLGMGQNQAKGSYVSTEDINRDETKDNPARSVRVKIKKPFTTTGDIFADIQRAIIANIAKRFDKRQIEDLSDTEIDLLAEMVTEHFTNEGYDSIYFPESESQEGELIVFDRNNVEFTREWTSYDEAIHQASQVVLATPPIKNSEFMKSDKSVELNVKYKKLREQLRTLNKLVNCR